MYPFPCLTLGLALPSRSSAVRGSHLTTSDVSESTCVALTVPASHSSATLSPLTSLLSGLFLSYLPVCTSYDAWPRRVNVCRLSSFLSFLRFRSFVLRFVSTPFLFSSLLPFSPQISPPYSCATKPIPRDGYSCCATSNRSFRRRFQEIRTVEPFLSPFRHIAHRRKPPIIGYSRLISFVPYRRPASCIRS